MKEEAESAPRPPSTRVLAAHGAMIVGAVQAYRIGLSFLSNVLLARLLTPMDFGLVAMVSSCVAFVSIIQDLGLNQSTIQRERISQAQVSALFWLSIGFSFILALFLAASAPVVTWFFGDSRLTALTIAFAILIIFGGAQSQQLALLSREMRFKTLAWIDALAATISVAAGIITAWLTSSYWSLFVASLASVLASFACLWAVSSFRPSRPSFEGDFHEILKFGSGISGFNIVNYFARNADNLLIGRYYGAAQLGLYDRAYRLLLFPLAQIQVPLGRVMYPVLCGLQSDPERYRKAYTESTSLLMMAAQPGLVFAIVFAEDVFLILLGPQWMPAVPIFRWLGLAGLSQLMTSTVGWLFLSQGRGGDYFKFGLLNGVAAVASFVIGISWGPLGVAVAYAVANYAVTIPLAWWISGRSGPVRTRDMLVTAFPHVVATAVSAAVLMGMRIVLPLPSVFACLGLAILSYGIYGAIMIAFPKKRMMLGETLRMFVSMRPSSGPAKSNESLT
jgi:PST family polysaccharide transporter